MASDRLDTPHEIRQDPIVIEAPSELVCNCPNVQYVVGAGLPASETRFRLGTFDTRDKVQVAIDDVEIDCVGALDRIEACRDACACASV